MKIRALLAGTAVISSILGAIVVYLILSVPNDLRADGLLKRARTDLAAGRYDQARESLATIIQQYPRTDAAAAATVALVTLGEEERDQLKTAVVALSKQSEAQAKQIADLQKSVTDVQNAPPKVVTVTAPPPKPPAKKQAPAKKKTRSRRRR